jgi:hypothetical protein
MRSATTRSRSVKGSSGHHCWRSYLIQVTAPSRNLRGNRPTLGVFADLWTDITLDGQARLIQSPHPIPGRCMLAPPIYGLRAGGADPARRR